MEGFTSRGAKKTKNHQKKKIALDSKQQNKVLYTYTL